MKSILFQFIVSRLRLIRILLILIGDYIQEKEEEEEKSQRRLLLRLILKINNKILKKTLDFFLFLQPKPNNKK